MANIDFVEFDNGLEDWLDFLGFGGGRFWDPKSIEHLSKNEVGQGGRPGIDLYAMLVNLGSQVGAPNLLIIPA